MDGARIWNSIVAKKDNPKIYGDYFDTMSVCLSKGLGCPIGSVLVGKKEFIDKALRVRKILGGGMRQVGYLAAAGLYAIENNISRMSHDHNRSKEIGLLFSKKSFVQNVNDIETNIVIIELSKGTSKQDVVDYFTEKDIVFDWNSMGKEKIRIVTHLNHTDSDQQYLIEAIDNYNI